jgi:hypothetical protein
VSRVVIDPRILADGALIEQSRRRALLVVIACGKVKALIHDSDAALLEADASEAEAAEIGGLIPVDSAAIDDWLARLPSSVPDVELVSSRPLQDVAHRLVADNCLRVPDLYRRTANVRLDALASEYVIVPRSADQARSAAEWCLVTAYFSGTSLVVSDELGHGTGTPHVHDVPGPSGLISIEATTFNEFVSAELEPLGFELDRVDGRLLADACRLLKPPSIPRARLA